MNHDIQLMRDLGQVWLIDFDGTIAEHNGHLNGADKLLPGVKKFWKSISKKSIIIIITARPSAFRESTSEFLISNGLNYDYLIMDMPKGERILINDCKPDGTITAYSKNLIRDTGMSILQISYY